jgi:hypothetical protein
MIDAITIAEGGCTESEDSLEIVAGRVASILIGQGYTVKVWTKGGYVRVYVSRKLSKRNQGMGYVSVETDGRNYNGLTRQMAGIRAIVELSLKKLLTSNI